MTPCSTTCETTTLDVLELAQGAQDYMVEVRRFLHMYPELSWKEDNTISFIKSEIVKHLKNYKGSSSLTEKKGGLILDLNISPEFDRILFRADVDALPIQEETNLSFSSQVPNVMHACGHDCHAAMLLGALKVITSKNLEIKHNIRFIFQRAEEVPFVTSGGESLVKDGIMKNISRAYALHISSKDELGVLRSKPGPMMANCTTICFEIKCMGGHVMCPESGSNAIDVMTDIHNYLKGFALRAIGPKERVSFVPAVSNSGTAANIMPEYAKATYAFRNYLKEDIKNDFLQNLKKRIQAIASTYQDACLHSFDVFDGYPVLVNDYDSFSYVDALLQTNNFKTSLSREVFAGEDFAYYLKKVKGSYWSLGAKQGKCYGHHTSLFNPDEEAFSKGAAFWLLLAVND